MLGGICTKEKGGKHAWVRGAPRRGDGSIVGVAGVATAGGAPYWLARGHACKLDSDRALALLWREAYPSGSASAHSGWNASELGSGR
jgi:hypothetical protein